MANELLSEEPWNIGIFGGGLIGSCWAAIFSQFHRVVVYDIDDSRIEQAKINFQTQLQTIQQIRKKRLNNFHDSVEFRCTPKNLCDDLWLKKCNLIMECLPEILEMKQNLFAEIDKVVDEGSKVIICSSSSCIPASKFTELLHHRDRCLVTHPVNPPTLLPLVELVPAPWTSEDALQKAKWIFENIGQRPIVLKREAVGFAVNRLQYALMRAAMQLVDEGVVDPDGVDLAVTEGLGPRYAFMGPLGITCLNATGGYRGYINSYGNSMRTVLTDMGESTIDAFDDKTHEKIANYVEHFLEGSSTSNECIETLKKQRDTVLKVIAQTKEAWIKK